MLNFSLTEGRNDEFSLPVIFQGVRFSRCPFFQGVRYSEMTVVPGCSMFQDVRCFKVSVVSRFPLIQASAVPRRCLNLWTFYVYCKRFIAWFYHKI